MKCLQNFLHPQRKPNIKFILSSAFADDEGKPLEWEMRELSAKEGAAILRELEDEGKSYSTQESMMRYIAEALVVPDLHDAELVAAVSEENNGKILKPHQILELILTDAEVVKLTNIYAQHSSPGTFAEQIKEAKN